MSENVRYETYKEEVPGNLLDAPPGELDLYGIPQRPDALAETLLFAFWKKLVSPPFRRITPKFGFHGFGFQTQPPSAIESSLNWSGAVLSPPRPKRFVIASAGWIAPKVTRPSAPALFTHSDDPKSLIWVGLDGYNGRLPKMSLPQIGTAHRPEDSPPDQRHFAWWYWWYHGLNKPVMEIINFKILPGNEILAGLEVLISKDILFFIKNQHTGDFCSFCARQPPVDIEPLGSSAEWVVERPTDPTSLKLYPLADYGSVDFKDCFAVAADSP
jgi:Peptidase A4 family